MNITFPSNTTEIIDSIRGAIGRDVYFYTESKIPCSACDLDPVTDTSLDSFCPVCSGLGYQYTYEESTISGHVIHNPQDMMKWTSGGQLYEGDCRVQIKYTLANDAIVNSATRVNADGDNYTIHKKIYRGVPEINRILLDLKQRP